MVLANHDLYSFSTNHYGIAVRACCKKARSCVKASPKERRRDSVRVRRRATYCTESSPQVKRKIVALLRGRDSWLLLANRSNLSIRLHAFVPPVHRGGTIASLYCSSIIADDCDKLIFRVSVFSN